MSRRRSLLALRTAVGASRDLNCNLGWILEGRRPPRPRYRRTLALERRVAALTPQLMQLARTKRDPLRAACEIAARLMSILHMDRGDE